MGMKNLGHKLGEVDLTCKENTIGRFKSNIKYEGKPAWKYLEFDLVETSDNQLIVYHDRDFRAYGNKEKVADIPFDVIKSIYSFIPKFSILAEEIRIVKFTKPIRIEIKRLHSEKARADLLTIAETIRRYQPGIDVDFIAFRSHWKKSYPKTVRAKWAAEFAKRGFSIWNVKNKKKDLFRSNGVLDKVLNCL